LEHNLGMDTAKPRILSAWDLAFLAGLLALAIFYGRILPLLPDPVPTHFDAIGRTNGWTPKAQLHWLVFGAPIFLWTVLFLIGAIASLMPGGGGRVGINPLRGLMGLGLCLLMAGCLLVPLDGMAALQGGILGFGICLVLGIIFMVRDGWQAVARMPRSPDFRAGLFYVNSQDPRLWVEKRVGVGWTLNFARPAAYGVMALLGLVMVGLALVVLATVRK